jgi:hypothetical protein
MKLLLPFSIGLALLAAVAPSRADEPVPVPASLPEPTLPPSYRHFVGLQVGGTSPMTLVYRYRLFQPLFLEVGGFGAPEALAMFSAGVVVAFHQSDRLMVYSGVGASACLIGDRSLAFLHGRVGLGVKLGASRRQMLSAEVGAWSGWHRKYEHDTGALITDERFTIPMAGLSYLVGLGS